MDEIKDQIEVLGEQITKTDLWVKIGSIALQVVLIIILSMIVIKISHRIINRLFKNRRHGPLTISERRENTLTKLLKSIMTYVVYFIAFIMILATFGFEIMPLLAGAGVAGIAIGFGAQSLVKDIISGFFIVFEDQFSVGDYISVTDISGTVEEIGLRTTKIKNFTGEQYIIPNGNITQVTNYSIYNGLALVDVNLSYETDVEEAEILIKGILMDLFAKHEDIVAEPAILGVHELELSHLALRVTAETLPGSQWSVARLIRKEIKEQLYNKGMNIPTPKIVMYTKDDQFKN